MISHEHQCIFIHIPKCAGTSVETAFGHFDGHAPRGGQDHRSIRMIEPVALTSAIASGSNRREFLRRVAHRLRPNPNAKNKLSVTPQQYRRYFKFTIVRNPWTRALSLYKNVIRDEVHRRELDVREDTSFADFLKTHIGKGMLRPQLDWIKNWRGQIPLDFICRFEHLPEDFERVLAKLGNPPIELPRTNVGAPAATPARFDESLNRLIVDAYGEEIALFDYSAVS